MDKKKYNSVIGEFDPKKPGAVGSRESILFNERSKDDEASSFIDEEIEKILNHVNKKLPQEAVTRLDVMGNVKDKLYNYMNQSFANMFNRYINTTEDELLKKVNAFMTKEELKSTSGYSPREITEIIDKKNKDHDLSTSSMESSIVRMYEQLQAQINRNITNIERRLSSILSEDLEIGGFIPDDNAHHIVKCMLKDDSKKPNTVYNAKLSINIPDSDLVSPIFHYRAGMDYIIKEIISNQIIDKIDTEIENTKEDLYETEEAGMTETEELFEKMNRVENFTDDNFENDNSKRYNIVSKKLLDKIFDLDSENPYYEFDPLNVRENIKKVIDQENLVNRGFNTAANSIAKILDNNNMSYQYTENLKNARTFIIKEYEDHDSEQLPDERYSIELKYLSLDDIMTLRVAFDRQIHEFDKEITKVWDVVTAIKNQNKNYKTINDFEDLYESVVRDIKRMKQQEVQMVEPSEEAIGEQDHWNEMMFVKPDETDVERNFHTYIYEKNLAQKKVLKIRNQLERMFGSQNPIERNTIETRLNFLEKQLTEFFFKVNPYHIQSGLLLDINITSIKKKRITLKRLSNMVGDFLKNIAQSYYYEANKPLYKN